MAVTKKVLIYAQKENITQRLKYTLQFIFNFLGCEWELTSEYDDSQSFESPCVFYGEVIKESGIYLPVSPCLKDGYIENIYPKEITVNGVRCIFPLKEKGDFPFDLFGAIFYQLSRWEEYNSEAKYDEHNRYLPENSWLYGDCEFFPLVVNQWIIMLAEQIKKKYPKFSYKSPPFLWHSTFDIDFGYRYKGKGFKRSIGALGRDLLTGNWGEVGKRIKVLSGGRDSYDNYEEITRLTENPIFFVLFSQFSQYNKGINPEKSNALLACLNSLGEVGIHPSYATYLSKKKLESERVNLQEKLKKNVEKARMHFLQYQWPETQKNMIASGITVDYSMGYPNVPGFRAGTNMPFKMYDLKHDEILPLTIFPLAVMDGTLKDYLKYTPERAFEVIQKIMTHVKQFGGIFTTLWHEHTIVPNTPWRGVLEKVADEVKKY